MNKNKRFHDSATDLKPSIQNCATTIPSTFRKPPIPLRTTSPRPSIPDCNIPSTQLPFNLTRASTQHLGRHQPQTSIDLQRHGTCASATAEEISCWSSRIDLVGGNAGAWGLDVEYLREMYVARCDVVKRGKRDGWVYRRVNLSVVEC